MAEKTKIGINTQNIIVKLHGKAMEEIKSSEYTIFNSLIEFDQSDGKENPQIMVVKKDGSAVQEEEKSKCVEILKTYVKYFAGENFSEQIKEDNLNKLTKEDSENQEEDKNKDDNKSEDNQNDNSEQNQQGQEQGQEAVKENIDTKRVFISLLDRKVEHDVDVLFEAAATPPAPSKFKTIRKDAWRNAKSFLFGYGIFYKFWRGKTLWTMMKNTASTANRSLFAGVLADLANMKLQTSAGDINVGHMIAKGMRVFQRTKINVNDVDNHIRGIIKNDFPQSDAIVRVYDTPSLQSSLQDQGKWDPKYEKPFKTSKYAVTIEVSTRDRAYKQFNQKKIAEICTRAFGDSLKFRPFRGNRVGPDDVIKIEDYHSEYRNQSIYDRRTSSKDGASSVSENLNPFYQKSVKQMLDMLFETRGGIQNGQVEVTFFVRNPLINNPVRNKISTLVGPEGNVLTSPSAVVIPDLATYELSGFRFNGWVPDPNDFRPKSGESKHIDVEAKFDRPTEQAQHDLYIVPHPMIDSYNRKDDYEVSNDGTVTSKMSKKDFKREDFTR